MEWPLKAATLTRLETSQMHNLFANPTAPTLIKFLKRNHPGTRNILQCISQKCKTYDKLAPKLENLKFSMPAEEIRQL